MLCLMRLLVDVNYGYEMQQKYILLLLKQIYDELGYYVI